MHVSRKERLRIIFCRKISAFATFNRYRLICWNWKQAVLDCKIEIVRKIRVVFRAPELFQWEMIIVLIGGVECHAKHYTWS